MNAPTIEPPRPAEAVLAWAWAALIAVTALGHVTALRNVVTVAVALATLGWARRSLVAAASARRPRDWLAFAPVVALLAWAALSTAWSPAAAVTLSKLRTDLAMPALAGIAAFAFVHRRGRIDALVDGLVVGLVLLAALSAFAYLPVGSAPAPWPMERNGGIVRPLPHWYPGPGDASMYAILAIAPLTLAWRTRARHRWPRRRAALIVVGVVLLAFVLVTTNNRNAVLVAPVVVAFQWALDRRLASAPGSASVGRSWLRVGTTTVATLIALGVVAAVLEWGARERLAYLHRPRTADSAAVELIATDTRPRIWAYYVSRGLARPWIGTGFGRTVPGIGWHTERDADVAAIEANAYIHAHNVAINWWLQLGFVGIGLAVASLLALVRAARRRVDACGRSVAARRLDHALLAVLVAVFARNMTDDFLVYGMATATCVVVGSLMGALSAFAAAHRPAIDAARVDAEPDAEPVTWRRTP